MTNISATSATAQMTDTITDPRLVSQQRRYALVTVVMPTAGTAYAVVQAILRGVTAVDVVLCVVMYFLTLMGITVGFHRHLAHRSFQCSQGVRKILTVLGSMAAQGPVLHWVSNHRRHHSHSDKPGDPHSPNLHGKSFRQQCAGLWHAHIGSMFASEVTNFLTFTPDLVRDRAIMAINSRYVTWVLLGMAFPAIIGGVFSGTLEGAVNGLIWGGLVRMFLVHHAIWSITSIAHVFGKQYFRSEDHSRNSFLLALLTGGEGWHNNHHAFPNAALFTNSIWKIDIGGIVVRLLRCVGLAWNVNETSIDRRSAKAK